MFDLQQAFMLTLFQYIPIILWTPMQFGGLPNLERLKETADFRRIFDKRFDKIQP